jgi:hypothetical protein
MGVLNTTIEIEGTCPDGEHRHSSPDAGELEIEIDDQVILIPDAELTSVLLEEVIEHLATPNN